MNRSSIASSVLFAFAAAVAVGCSPSSPIGSGGSGGQAAVQVTSTAAGDTGASTSAADGSTTGAFATSSGTGGCVGDETCAPGTICDGGTCVPGCNATHGCEAGNTCCSGSCFDLSTDLEHCGMCTNACPSPPNIEVTCNGTCTFGACTGTFTDCDGNKNNGCEVDGACTCTPGDTQPCYDGLPGTESNAPCHAGTQTCNTSGTGWGLCIGQFLPQPELCSNGVDEDCNGVVDDVPDLDGDGWTVCDGDCCDQPGSACSNPELVNPGAFEAPGNMVDDDCDGTVDNVLGSCDGGLTSNSTNALDYARAMDLCSFTDELPPTPQQDKWGVISATFSRADGTGSPAANAKSIRPAFGSGVSPLFGSTMAVLSTGAAAAQTAPSNTSPAYAAFQTGQDNGTTSPPPADWLAANGGSFPNTPGCPAPTGGTTTNDPVLLKLRVRVPTNANSFSVSTFFYSAEYPEWVCSPYNDFFLTLLDSSYVPTMGSPPNPADKNLAFYDPPPAGAPFFPVGVNLAYGNTGLFSVCKNGPTGCATGSVAGNISTCTSTAQLTGTGFDLTGSGACGVNNQVGGGTGWLTTSGNVTPGETIELRFVIWDTADHIYDSLVLLDNFIWSVSPSTPGTNG